MPTIDPNHEVRVLLIAEAANPEWVSVPLVGWSHARAIADVTPTHLVTQVRNRDAILRTGMVEADGDWGTFTAIDSEPVARPLWRIATMVRGGAAKGFTTNTAIEVSAYYYFERLVWKQFGARIAAEQFDVVHRLTPLTPTAPSLIAAKCRRVGVPFVLGPLNGGVAWPREFDSRRQDKEWLAYVRDAYKLMPGYRSTRENAAAIIVGSRDTFEQISERYRDRCVYAPENAIDPQRIKSRRNRRALADGPLRVVFVGRLVPYKGADMLLEAAAPLVQRGAVTVEIIGDGPVRPALEEFTDRQRLRAGVTFTGWVEHERVLEHLANADVFGFPSIREFGGGAVLEAMAVGLAPIIVDYGGPAELVTERTGIKVPLGTREAIVAGVRAALDRLLAAPDEVDGLGAEAMRRTTTHFTWAAKAAQTKCVYEWVLGRRPKPEFRIPLPDSEEEQQDVADSGESRIGMGPHA